MEAMRSLEKGSRREIGFYSQNLFLLLVLGLLWGVFHLLTLGQPGKFLSPQNLWNLSVQTAVVAILVGGMVLVIVARQIDLSVGSLLGFTGMAMALLQAVPPIGEGWPWPLALLVGLALGVNLCLAVLAWRATDSVGAGVQDMREELARNAERIAQYSSLGLP